ncbi:hypothetical protein niasHT_008268 [Heterodera trifolii]|uniref:Uncharacterized protein n=1 Tax=Heterodera trifolii TaxID=157864 RepID=A0ABD2M1J9_9BILA
MQFEGDNLDFSSLREENGLGKDDFRKGVLLYLCYGGNETAMLVNNVAITIPILNYIFVRLLLEQLFEFILESPNPFTMQKRICVGGHHPIDLPKSLSQPARVMASKGIQPQVRSDDKEIYQLFNYSRVLLFPVRVNSPLQFPRLFCVSASFRVSVSPLPQWQTVKSV